MKFIYIALAFSFTLLAHFSFSNNEIRLQHFSTKDGLSQNTINFIFQDSKGFIWIGTHDGLNKFDGVTFTVYKINDSDSTSIQSNDNYSIFEDKKGQLWIGTSQGVSLYNRDLDNFKNFKYSAKGGYTLRPVWDIEKSRDENKLWLGTSGGLFLFDTERESFEHFVIDGNDAGRNTAQVLLLDHQGLLWIGTNGGGLFTFDEKYKKFNSYKHISAKRTTLSDNIIRSIFEDSERNIWIGANKGILNKFNYQDTSFTHYPIVNNTTDGIFTILEDKSRNLWIGTDKEGLFQFDKNKSEFIPLNYETVPGNKVIRALYEDLKGNIWIGTYGGGIFLYDHLDNDFQFSFPYQNSLNNDQSNSVLAIYESPNDGLWLGTDGGGLVQYNKRTETTIHYKKGGINGVPGNTILSLKHAQDKNKLYIGTFFEGFSVFDTKNNKFTNYRHDPNNKNSLSDNTIWDVFVEKDGLVWLATNTGGLNLFNPRDQSFKQFSYKASTPGSLSENSVRCIYKDSRNNLWVGTVYGLNLLNAKDSTFTHFFHNPSDKKSLSNNLILCIYEDSNKNLWVGTHGGGLNKFNLREQTFAHYKEKDGLPGNVVYGILEDKQGNLWISTDKGLSKFNPATKDFKNFDVTSGFISDQFNIGSYYKNDEGEMFFGSVNGICHFNPSKIKHNYYVPPVVITGFKVFNKGIGIGDKSPLKKHITEVETIVLPYNSSVINFTFAALNYTHAKKNKYVYKLEGFEEEWNEVGNQNNATFTNLDPGEYTFLVKGSNNDGIWNEKPTSLKLIITPPFWGTWWFRILIFTFFLTIVYFAYSLNMKNVHKQKEKLKELVDIRTVEIEEKNKLLVESEKINNQLIHERLNNEINQKSKELSKYTLLIIQKNRLLEDLKKKLREAVRNQNANKSADFKSIIRMINQNFSPEQEWAEFDANFNKVYMNFGEILKSRYPELTHNDIRLCALFRLDIPTRDIANIVGISMSSVKMARYRLRKKLGLESEEDLVEFLKFQSQQQD